MLTCVGTNGRRRGTLVLTRKDPNVTEVTLRVLWGPHVCLDPNVIRPWGVPRLKSGAPQRQILKHLNLSAAAPF